MCSSAMAEVEEINMENNMSDVDSLYEEVGNYFFTTDSVQDVQFIVGEQQEAIKAVRQLLINQSRVWWSMLCQDSPLAEKGDVLITDIEPDIFKLLLRHSYGGLDSLDDLSQDEIIKLCYCANKYTMKSLMKKIATHLQPRDVDGVFIALHCLVYFNLQDVEPGVKKLVQTQTTQLLSHPEFMECDADSVAYICKQEPLDCDELAVWNSVVQWAKYKAKSDEGPKLREWLLEPLKHIRLRTLSKSDLYDHVLPLDILSGTEISNLCKDGSRSLTVEIVEKVEKTLTVPVEIRHQQSFSENYLDTSSSSSCFVIKNKSIQLQSFICRSNMPWPFNDFRYNHMNLAEKTSVNIKMEITKITDWMTSTSSEEPIVLDLKEFKYYPYDRITVPTLINNKGIPLQANSKYKVELKFSKGFPSWAKANCAEGHVFDHGIFYCSEVYAGGIGAYPCHIQHFTYQVADD